MRKTVVFLGGGGHARGLLEALRLSGQAGPVAILEANRSLWGRKVAKVPVIGGDDRLVSLFNEGVRFFVVGIGSTGDNRPRQRLFERAVHQGLVPLSVIHPSAVVSSQALIEPGAQVLAGCVINPGAHVGANSIVNTGAIVEHDVHLGRHVHIASGACVLGGVRVEDGAFVGALATVRQGLSVRAGAGVAAGAVVTKTVPIGMCVAGVPARRLARGRHVES